MLPSYDVVVAGGSIAGLLCAREVASAGYTVLVVEEDYEIGTPEHCGGLVSSRGLAELGIIPSACTLQHHIARARIRAPDMSHNVTLDATRQNVTGVSRRELDKQVAHQAQRAGAEIITMASMQGASDDGNSARIISRDSDSNHSSIQCKVVVDARGAASLAQKDRTGIIPSAQYEVYADWIEDGTVEVIPDSIKYPGFFAWVIPFGRGRGRIGAAGRNINAASALKALLDFMAAGSEYAITRKIFAPVWIKGPIKQFYDKKTIIIGDAAGQAKPTTAGGIFSSGMGGIFAGQAIASHLKGSGFSIKEAGDAYQKRWHKKFGREFDKQLLARRILERADNTAITGMIKAVTPGMLEAASAGGDFDFHTSAIIRLLGASGAAKAAHSMIVSEIRRII